MNSVSWWASALTPETRKCATDSADKEGEEQGRALEGLERRKRNRGSDIFRPLRGLFPRLDLPSTWAALPGRKAASRGMTILRTVADSKSEARCRAEGPRHGGHAGATFKPKAEPISIA
jgi:hypothetical protein